MFLCLKSTTFFFMLWVLCVMIVTEETLSSSGSYTNSTDYGEICTGLLLTRDNVVPLFRSAHMCKQLILADSSAHVSRGKCEHA